MKIILGPMEITGEVGKRRPRPRRNRRGTYYMMDYLLPHLGFLRQQLVSASKQAMPEYHVKALELEMLPYSLMACQSAIYESVSIQERIARQAKRREEGQVQLSTEQWQELAYPVDTFLERAHRCHSALTYYLGACEPKLKTRDLEKVVLQIRRKRINLGEVLNGILLQYWRVNGEALTHYRNVSQHCAVVSSEALLFTDKEGRAALRFVLPQNPNARNINQLKYENSSVHAYPYITKSFGVLLELCYRTTRILSERFPARDNPDGTITQVMWPTINRTPVTLGEGVRIDGHALTTHKRMAERLRARMKSNSDYYDEHVAPLVTAKGTKK